MNRSESFANLDPVAATEVDRVSSLPAFNALMAEIVAIPPDATPAVDDNIDSLGLRDRPRRVRPPAAIAIACAIILLAGVLIVVGQGGPGNSGGKDSTGHAISGRGQAPTHVQTGTWKLMDDALSGTWRQEFDRWPPSGPPQLPEHLGLLCHERALLVPEGRLTPSFRVPLCHPRPGRVLDGVRDASGI